MLFQEAASWFYQGDLRLFAWSYVRRAACHPGSLRDRILCSGLGGEHSDQSHCLLSQCLRCNNLLGDLMAGLHDLLHAPPAAQCKSKASVISEQATELPIQQARL